MPKGDGNFLANRLHFCCANQNMRREGKKKNQKVAKKCGKREGETSFVFREVLHPPAVPSWPLGVTALCEVLGASFHGAGTRALASSPSCSAETGNASVAQRHFQWHTLVASTLTVIRVMFTALCSEQVFHKESIKPHEPRRQV